MKACFYFVLMTTVFISFVNRSVASCDWCVVDNSSLEKDFVKISKLKPAEQLKSIEENMDVQIDIFKTTRPVPKDVFHWGKVREDNLNLEDVSRLKNIMGRTLCKNESPLSQKKMTVLLASDAPQSTLLHEALHVKQIQKDSSWCDISKKIWESKTISEQESRRIRDMEWDVRLFLWKHVSDFNFSLEDKINVAAGLLEEAALRSRFDSSAIDLIKKDRVESSLQQWIREYKK